MYNIVSQLTDKFILCELRLLSQTQYYFNRWR